MRINSDPNRCYGSRAFTLAEVLLASTIVSILVLGNMATVYEVRIMGCKDADRGVVSSFMQHYIELVKALPFDQVMPTEPLSGLYSGLDNTPRITLPSEGNWFSIGIRIINCSIRV
jgi:prepilin-type N-terminal cleavage/methylation domain-containing protein